MRHCRTCRTPSSQKCIFLHLYWGISSSNHFFIHIWVWYTKWSKGERPFVVKMKLLRVTGVGVTPSHYTVIPEFFYRESRPIMFFCIYEWQNLEFYPTYIYGGFIRRRVKEELLRSLRKTLPQEDTTQPSFRSAVLSHMSLRNLSICHCHPRMYLSGIQTLFLNILLNSLDSRFRGNDQEIHGMLKRRSLDRLEDTPSGGLGWEWLN